MKKMILLSIVLLLTVSLIISACTLPQPVKKTPPASESTKAEPTWTSQAVQPTQEPMAETPLPSATAQQAVTETPAQPTAAPPTEAPVVPTATPLPQQVDISGATRIQFAPGATSATVDGELDEGDTKSYVLAANAGQTMTVNIWSPNSDVYQTITGVSDGKVLVDANAKATLWTGILPATQDYLVEVIAGNGRTSYSIGIIIPAGATATAGPTPTLSSAQFDPNAAYGKPKMVDPMNTAGSINWTTDGKLPNTEDIQMTLQDDKMYVTGKQLGFATWWFSWPSIKNFYIEMSVDSGTCSGKDAYGMIIRGPEHEAGVSYGYVVAFACDGSYQVYRLDRVDPYMAVDLVNWTKSNSILAGSNQKNKLGIKAEGDKLTIYANGYQLIQVTDSKYTGGRYGVYIRPDVTWYYTYRPIQIAWWELPK